MTISRTPWPLEPEASRWELPTLDQIRAIAVPMSVTNQIVRAIDQDNPEEDDPAGQSEHDLVAAGADLAPGTLLHAYRNALFPMPLDRKQLGWWSPIRRGVLPLQNLRVTRSLKRSVSRFDVRVNTSFEAVMRACGDSKRNGGWITQDIIAAYVALHELGWAHSVECWNEDNHLVGGLYGIATNGLFAGESMFHVETDASKVALLYLVNLLREGDNEQRRLLDVQWRTPHLGSLGVAMVTRDHYCDLLADALTLELPPRFLRR